MYKTHFYYGQIHVPGSKALYQEILRSIRGHKTWASVPYTLSEAEIYQALYALNMDYPELFYVRLFGDGCSMANVNAPGARVEFVYEYARREEEKRIRETEGYLRYLLSHMPAAVKKTEFGKALWLHDLISRNLKYDERAREAGAEVFPDSYRFVGGLLRKTAVCAGVSELFQILCERSDLWCASVVGRAGSDGRKGKNAGTQAPNHAWNLLRVDNTFSYVDVTWDLNTGKHQAGVSHRYFGMGDSQCAVTHHPASYIHGYPAARIQMPRCPDESRVNYYVRTGALIHQLSELDKPIETMLRRKRRSLSFQLSPQLRKLSCHTVMDWVSKRVFREPQVRSHAYWNDEATGIYEIEVTYRGKEAGVCQS